MPNELVMAAHLIGEVERRCPGVGTSLGDPLSSDSLLLLQETHLDCDTEATCQFQTLIHRLP